MSTTSRREEFDALRGLMLVVMTLDHLPTGLHHYANQPLGWVSAAEGFVFLSAFLVGTIYSRQLLEKGFAHVRERLWKRAGKLYFVHLALLLFAFTIVAGIAVVTGRQTLHNHLSFFFQSPVRAVASSPLLLYQPPLLDILPMYVVFLALSPLVLRGAARGGWAPILTASGLLWTLSQLGVRNWLFAKLAVSTGIPLSALGSFDWLGWQLVWVAGLWMGAGALRRGGAADPAWLQEPFGVGSRKLLLAGALAIAMVLFASRHQLATLGFLQLSPNSSWLSKWHLGALRVVNFAALAVLVRHTVLPALAILRLPGLALLGRSSLAVFTTHLPFAILSRALIVDEAPLTLAQQACVLALTFGAMLAVAWYAGRAGSPGTRPESSAAQAASTA
ncbi:MAG: succinyl transferase OpgC [Proteobacteria bacterium]|nr:succinyl transferase OpgC [Pseudomonadota bacterium]